jgi:hypothetical protein
VCPLAQRHCIAPDGQGTPPAQPFRPLVAVML